jgi:hypothetical protein
MTKTAKGPVINNGVGGGGGGGGREMIKYQIWNTF